MKTLELLIPIRGADSALNPLHKAMDSNTRYSLTVELTSEGIIVRATPILEAPTS